MVARAWVVGAVVAVVACVVMVLPVVEAGPEIAAYYTNWAQYRQCRGGAYKFVPESVAPIASKLTRLIYAFAKIDTEGTVIPIEWNDCAQGAWPQCQGTPGSTMFERVMTMRQQHNPNMKVLISIGGWTWGSVNTCPIFSAMASSPATRSKFIDQAVRFSRTFGFDGIDIDWEYPGDTARDCHAEDVGNFKLLLGALRSAVNDDARKTGKPALLITLATPAGSDIAKMYSPGAISQYVDSMSIMTYDFHGSWDGKTGFNAPMQDTTGIGSVTDAVTIYLQDGVPANKILLGTAAYGRTWTGQASCTPGAAARAGPAQECTQGEGVAAGYEVSWLLAGGAQRTMDPTAQEPYGCNMGTSMWFSYDDEESYAAKAKLVKSRGLGGAMVWSLDQDDFPNGYPLINALYRQLNAAANATTATVATA